MSAEILSGDNWYPAIIGSKAVHGNRVEVTMSNVAQDLNEICTKQK